jgi:hypothetical protein
MWVSSKQKRIRRGYHHARWGDLPQSLLIMDMPHGSGLPSSLYLVDLKPLP